MDKKKQVCPICQKPILDPDKTEEDRSLEIMEFVATGYVRRPFGFCRCDIEGGIRRRTEGPKGSEGKYGTTVVDCPTVEAGEVRTYTHCRYTCGFYVPSGDTGSSIVCGRSE